MENEKQRWRGWVFWALCLILAAVFFYAGWIKLQDPTLFAIKIRAYDLLPDPWVAVTALLLPWLEIVCSISLLVGRLRRGALLGLFMMLLVFLFGMLSAWSRGLDIDCGCFSETLDRGSLLTSVLMDLALLAMVIVLWRRVSCCGVRAATKA
ncbi:MAG: MauE/DoxX family redox-associated membrane protein [Verrucomicrobiota bacterium]